VQYIISDLKISASQQNELNSSGHSRLRNQIHWARFYLVKAGYLGSSERGVWSLTSKGIAANLSDDASLSLVRAVQSQFTGTSENRDEAPTDDEAPAGTPTDEEDVDYRRNLIRTLLALSPPGFERLCQRLLREAGFEEVTVTGRSGDGGIDGHGLLQINPLVSLRVLFQCKRYKESVTPSQVRDFRGAMSGRAEQGIILTTGVFTAEARREATRDGVHSIELVDGERLVQLFEALGFGLRPVHTFAVDAAFFEEFR
jgi:restriction system protein